MGTHDLSKEALDKIRKGFTDFYLNLVTTHPDEAFVVMFAGGGTRWNFQRLSAKQAVAVVGGPKGSLLPVRDHHIYRVLDRAPGSDPDRPDSVTSEIAQMIHRTMCGHAKLGKDITLGEIQAAAEAQIRVRLEAMEQQEAEIVSPMGAAERPREGGNGSSEPRQLPRTAVQICIGDTIMSDPFDTPGAAKASQEWETAHQLPEVMSGGSMVWLRPVFEDHDDSE